MLSHESKDQSIPSTQDMLFSATSRGDLNTLKMLLEDKTKKINLNHKDTETGMTIFLKAAEGGHIAIIKYLLEQSGIEARLTTNKGLSALHLAASHGHYDVVALLLTLQDKFKVDPNLRAANNMTALHLAAGMGHIKVVKLLIDSGADTSIKFLDSTTALDLAVKTGHHEVSMLLDGSPQSMHTSLVQRMKVLGYHSNSEGICFGISEVAMLAALTSEAALAKYYQTIFLLRRLKASELVDRKAEHEKIIQQAELQALAEFKVTSQLQLNASEKVRFRELTLKYLKLIRGKLTKQQQEHEQEYIDILSLFDGIELEYRGDKYLHLSTHSHFKTQQHNPTWVSPLIRPALLDEKGGETQIAMFTGVYSKAELNVYFKTLRTRLRENNKINQPVAIALDCYTHAISIFYNPIHDSWRVINSERLPSNPKELKEQTFHGDLELADTLTEALVSKAGHSILRTRILAAKNCYIDVNDAINLWKQDIATLHNVTSEKVKFKGDMNVSWLYRAASVGDAEAVRSLLRSGASVNTVTEGDCFSALHAAVENHQIEVAKILLKTPGVKVNKKVTDGNTALGIACCKGYTEIVELLLQSKKIKLNTHNNDNFTPLMYAALKGYTNIVELLLQDKRTRVNLTGKHGATALYIAAEQGHFAIIKNLLKAGADTSIKAFDHCNLPLDAAIHYGHKDVVSLLTRDMKIKKIIADLAEIDCASQRYFAIKKLYHLVLDSKNDEEASDIISDFLRLDQQIRSAQCHHIPARICNEIQNEAYQNYVTGLSVKEIDIQFKKSISVKVSDSILPKNNLFSTQRQNPCVTLVDNIKRNFFRML